MSNPRAVPSSGATRSSISDRRRRIWLLLRLLTGGLPMAACVGAPHSRVAMHREEAMVAPCAEGVGHARVAGPTAPAPSWPGRVVDTLVADAIEFYDGGTMFGLGVGIGLAGLSANSQLDRDIYEDVLPEWRTDQVRELRDSVLGLGDGAYVLPALAGAALVGPWLGADGLGEFGERSLRAVIVGAPSMLALQRLIGAGRPDDPANRTTSEWEPFEHSNGVSGHAFLGSIPFLTVARMQDDVVIDGVCYAGSFLVAAARLQGSRHYFSQVMLGWWIGYLATGAVDDATGGTSEALSVLPYVTEDTIGILVTHRF